MNKNYFRFFLKTPQESKGKMFIFVDFDVLKNNFFDFSDFYLKILKKIWGKNVYFCLKILKKIWEKIFGFA